MVEKVYLLWNEFLDHVSCGFKNLRYDKAFADVTLACEDGEEVKSHRVILSASSPLLKKLLKGKQHQHPLVYISLQIFCILEKEIEEIR